MILFQFIGACIFWIFVFRFASNHFEWNLDTGVIVAAAVALCTIFLAIRAALVEKETPTPSQQQQIQQQQQNVTVNIMLTDEQLEAELEKRKRGQA